MIQMKKYLCAKETFLFYKCKIIQLYFYKVVKFVESSRALDGGLPVALEEGHDVSAGNRRSEIPQII